MNPRYKALAARVEQRIAELDPPPPAVVTLRAICEEGETPAAARERALAAHLATHPQDQDRAFFFVTRIVIRPPTPAPEPEPAPPRGVEPRAPGTSNIGSGYR
jgi:hypothetical protein